VTGGLHPQRLAVDRRKRRQTAISRIAGPVTVAGPVADVSAVAHHAIVDRRTGVDTRSQLRVSCIVGTLREMSDPASMRASGGDAVTGTWPVVGRDDEIDLIVQQVDEAHGCRTVVLGAAGVGKTRLLRTTAAELEARGRTVRWVVGAPSGSLPFGALVTYLPADLGASEPATLVGHAVRELSTSAVGRPVVMVEDVHFLDHPSGLVVGQLLRSSEVDVICSWRTGEPNPDLEWVVHDEQSVVIELQPLGADDVAVLLDAVLGPVAPTAADTLFDQSGGSVLFLRELVTDAQTSGALARGRDGWMLDPSWRPGARVMELVTRRIGRRAEPEQRALEALAVAEPVALDLLAAVADADALVALERAQLIEVGSDGLRASVRFAHPLFGDAVRSRLGRAAARQRTRALADALAATGLRRRGDLLTLARWRLEGGGDLEPAQWAIAARQAIVIEAPEAASIARRAVDAGAGALSWAALGQLRADARDLRGALDAFSQAAACATSDAERVDVAVGHARVLSWVADRTDEALDRLDLVAARVASTEAELPLAIARIAVLVNAGRLVEGLDEADTFLAGDDLPLEPRVEASTLRSIGLAFAGRTNEARVTADSLLSETLSDREFHPHLLASAALPCLVVRLIAGELESTAELIGRFRAEARGAEATGYLAALEGRLALMEGREHTALGKLRFAQQSLSHTMTLARSMWTAALVGEAEAFVGSSGPTEVVREFDRGGDLAHRFLVVDAMRAAASTRGRAGDLPGARQLLHDAFDLAGEAGMVAGQVWVAYEGLRIYDDHLVGSLAALEGRMDGPSGQLFPRHAAARLADDANELEGTALALAEAGFCRAAAHCAAEASSAHRRHGVTNGATRCAALAQQYGERCEGDVDPNLAGLPLVDELTSRERDVTLLAAQGLTNRAIADATHTSVRTVEGHLLRAYRKLGISSRAELTSYFGTGARPPDQ
jgi:DNA-binding CsgD family transcriptional regulator